MYEHGSGGARSCLLSRRGPTSSCVYDEDKFEHSESLSPVPINVCKSVSLVENRRRMWFNCIFRLRFVCAYYNPKCLPFMDC